MTCPFCNAIFPINDDTVRTRYPSFFTDDAKNYAAAHGLQADKWTNVRDSIAVQFALCPSCNKFSISATGVGTDVNELAINIIPSSLAKQFPDYVPQSIRKDYEEACQIVNLSPKASATLSRRCLQGMIRDYWQITNKKSLYDEIEAINDKVDPQVKKVLNGVRQIGNIGAHMEKDINLIVDIDPNEAEKLIKLIEYLIEQWYIKRNETEELLNSIIEINDEKQSVRNS